ncbi:hypothetical protein AB1Y20_012021 [Prymnesium parvum]|uniref:Potassium channel domain-containing protein n=1 Tax=Prymnesium parvum TaxID=97485 RepID=A0AB34INB2_PRYPA
MTGGAVVGDAGAPSGAPAGAQRTQRSSLISDLRKVTRRVSTQISHLVHKTTQIAPKRNSAEKAPAIVSTRLKRMIQASIVDDVHTRMAETRKLSMIGVKKKVYARKLLWSSGLSIFLMMIAVELRLNEASTAYINAVKCTNLFVNTVGITFFLLYYMLEHRLVVLARSDTSRLDIILPLVELLSLVIGIIPPWAEGYIYNPRLDGQFSLVDVSTRYDDDNSRIHIDALGVLTFARLPLMAKWVVASGLLHSPTFLAWKYNVEVSPMFRLKYLFTRRPMPFLLWSTMLSWLSFAFILHVFEFRFTPSFGTWTVTSFDYLVGLGYGPMIPDTLVGRLCAGSLTVVGVIAAAMLTAMFADSSELDQSELWLITTIERFHHDRQVKDLACKLLQNAFRAKKVIDGLKQTNGTLGTMHRAVHDSKVVKVARGFIFNSKFRRGMRELKRARMNAHGARTIDNVVNIRVLRSDVTRLNLKLNEKFARVDDRQAAMEKKLDALFALLTEPRSSVNDRESHARDSELHDRTDVHMFVH